MLTFSIGSELGIPLVFLLVAGIVLTVFFEIKKRKDRQDRLKEISQPLADIERDK